MDNLISRQAAINEFPEDNLRWDTFCGYTAPHAVRRILEQLGNERENKMTVKDLITILLDFDMDKEVTVEYPTDKGKIVGNYSRYAEAKKFEVTEYMHGVTIGVSDDN